MSDQLKSDSLLASEALFGFCGWLTTRKDKTIMSSTDDAAPICGLIKKFCDENKLHEPRDGWENNLIHPSGGRSHGNQHEDENQATEDTLP